MNTSHQRINEGIKNLLLKGTNVEPAFKGTVLEGRERRYTVLNEHDIEKYLKDDTKELLETSLDMIGVKIETGRIKDGKKPFNSYIVINVDEPFVDEIIEILKRNDHWD